MACKTTIINFQQINEDIFLRVDSKFHSFIKKTNWYVYQNNGSFETISLSQILFPHFVNFTFEEGEVYRGIPTGRGYIDEDGEIKDYLPVSCEDCPDRIKYAISQTDILISSIRQAATPALLFEDLKNIDNYVFSNGYFVLGVKDSHLPKFLLYLLRTKRIKNILDNSICRGIGISSYKLNDFLNLKIPKISLHLQREILSKIKPIEKEIRKLKTKIKSDKEIINSIIIRVFNLDYQALMKLDDLKILEVNLPEFEKGTTELRDSVRFTKMRLIQNELIKHFDSFDSLDVFLLQPKTKNGWSPENNEIGGASKILGIDALHFNGILTTDNPKYTDETREDIENFTVHEGDFFISRGNTVDLVALASIAHDIEDEYIFPDIMIKLFVDESRINKYFLAYLFNSIIGRLYFKYASKGKQQTMVKVSSDTIKNFIVPKIPMIEQEKIVNEIKKETDKQIIIKKQIMKLRNKIDVILEKTILDAESLGLKRTI